MKEKVKPRFKPKVFYKNGVWYWKLIDTIDNTVLESGKAPDRITASNQAYICMADYIIMTLEPCEPENLWE